MSKTSAVLLTLAIGLGTLPACKPAAADQEAIDLSAIPMGVVAKVKVDDSARIFIDGREVTVEGLKQALAALPKNRAAVQYHRTNPMQEAPPDVAAVSRQVMAAIIEAKLPVSLALEDFD